MNRFLPTPYEPVGQSRINLSCFYIVAPLDFKDFFQVVFNVFIKDGAGDFNPAVNISWHQISGSDVAFFISIIAEYHEPGMLQKAVNDPYCFNVFADILNAWHEGDHAPYYQADCNSGTAGLVKVVYYFVVG